MAIAPPKKIAIEVVDPAEAHEAVVKELERCIDASLKGLPPAYEVNLPLPLGDYTPEILAEVEAHYVAAGWKTAAIDAPSMEALVARGLVVDPAHAHRAPLVLTLTT